MSQDSHAPSHSGSGAAHHSLSVLSTTHSPGDVVAAIDDRSTTSRVHAVCGTGCRGHVRVCVTVANTDGTATTEQIRVDGGGLGNTSATVTVDAGETRTATVVLETATGADSLGTQMLTVAVGDDSMERSVETRLPALRGADSPPQDLDGDSTFEDIDGDGTFDISDVYILYNNVRSASVQEHSWAFDFNGDGNVDTYDVWVLVDRLY